MAKLLGTRVGHFFIRAIVGYRSTCPIYEVVCDCGSVSRKLAGNIRTQKACSVDCPFYEPNKLEHYKRLKERAPKHLYKGELLSARQIAEKTGCSKSAINWRILNGLQLDRTRGKAYRGKKLREWVAILGISKQRFLQRVKKYGPDDDRTYLPKQVKK